MASRQTGKAGFVLIIILVTSALCTIIAGVLLRNTVFFNDITIKYQRYEQQLALTEGMLQYGIAYALNHYDGLQNNILQNSMAQITLPYTLPCHSMSQEQKEKGVGDGDGRNVVFADCKGVISIKKQNNALYIQGTLIEKNKDLCTISCTVEKQYDLSAVTNVREIVGVTNATGLSGHSIKPIDGQMHSQSAHDESSNETDNQKQSHSPGTIVINNWHIQV